MSTSSSGGGLSVAQIKQRKKMIFLVAGVGAGLVALVMASTSMMNKDTEKARQAAHDKPDVVKNYTGATEGVSPAATRAAQQQSMAKVEDALRAAQRNADQKDQQFNDLQKKVSQLADQLEKSQREAARRPLVPPPTAASGVAIGPDGKPLGSPLATPSVVYMSSVTLGTGATGNGVSQIRGAGSSQDPIANARDRDSRGRDYANTYNRDDPLNYNRAAGRDAKNYLPSGTHMHVTLLNGADAPTGGSGQSNPMPVLVTVSGPAKLPNGFQADLKNCTITTYANGDLSSERAIFKLDRLSCIDDDAGAIDVQLKGYLTGPDGKVGIRGRLVSKTGQAMANALYAAVGSGIGGAFKNAGTTFVNPGLGTAIQQQSMSEGFRSGFGEGVSKGMDRIAQYYINLADKMYPVVEVDPGLEGDVVLMTGTSIERR
ncbi:TrbI/VirB10 family protein [Burkholderia vietnamiensis]|uniref:TrbI/VirB10 family protein n=1 Tax=Burkholderia vietnamiensis TaxID=60552 RepID=UPI0009B944CD|nr:TrbI/VirB10 family protein [Burkholderia vietnamiensis]MBR8189177.1 hypothetical protein [Burkholderia vietnamiensis]HDR9174384.1 hypothetical protein [Burkholderia vietnamiensis]